jgi:release factor glutamine methyltransferase
LDAELLLSQVLNCNRTYLVTWPEQSMCADELLQLQQLVIRRSKGEPIAYILGKQAFWNLELKVTPDVLIPRPDTELLVELALEKLDQGGEHLILDLGAGSGAIGLAIASERPKSKVVAVDRSAAALAVLAINKTNLNINNIDLVESNWFDYFYSNQYSNYKNKFALIISNPPYIAVNDPHLLQADLSFEPQSALVAKQQGLADLFYIIDNARDFLGDNSWLMLEHGWKQHLAVQKRLLSQGYQTIKSHCDLAGIYRVTYAKKN